MQLFLRHNPFSSGKGSSDGGRNTAGVELAQRKFKPNPRREADLGISIDEGSQSPTYILSPAATRAETSSADCMNHVVGSTASQTDMGTVAYNTRRKIHTASNSHSLELCLIRLLATGGLGGIWLQGKVCRAKMGGASSALDVDFM